MGLPCNISFPQFKTFLFCSSLRFGCIFIGYFKLICWPLLAFSYFASYLRYITHFGRIHESGPYVVPITSIMLLEATFALLLLSGVYKAKSAHLKIWLVIQFAQLAQAMFSSIMKIFSSLVGPRPSMRLELTEIGILQIFWVIDALFTLTVYSYYRDKYFRDRDGNLLQRDFLDTLDDEEEQHWTEVDTTT